jgi:peptidoglycan hydrolase CwlO-like protein
MLEDLDFADDIALLSHKYQDTQKRFNRVDEEAEKTRLKINTTKTEIRRVSNKQHTPIHLHQKNIKEVDKFIYLGNVISKDGRSKTSRAA